MNQEKIVHKMLSGLPMFVAQLEAFSLPVEFKHFLLRGMFYGLQEGVVRLRISWPKIYGQVPIGPHQIFS